MKMKKIKGSVLVVTLIVLGIILVTALSVSLTSLKQRTASMGESKTGVAFQNAQSGIEIVMDGLLRNQSTLASLGSIFNCNDSTGKAIITPDIENVFVEVRNDSESTPALCGDLASSITIMKSVGSDTGNSEKRAIEAVVASTTGPSWQNSTTWESISTSSGTDKGWAYAPSPDTAWYPSNCMAWLKDTPCSSATGKAYPINCLNNSASGLNKIGWEVDGRDIKLTYENGGPLLNYWDGDSFESKSSGCIKVMLWK